MKSTITAAVGLLALAHAGLSAAEPQRLEPTPFPDNEYRGTLLDGSYDPAIPTPESLLGFPVGQRPATPEQIVAAVSAWDEASDRATAVEYARSHEGRPLYYVMISTPDNLARVDEVKAGIGKLADPRGVPPAETERIIGGLPAVAWMAYSIHGNESSGADAALAAVYHLVASTDDDVVALLEDMIVLIDPSQNPDGRARFMRSLEGHRGAAPNVDSQSLLHTDFWPYGRTNHYLFDLNRDYFFLVHPETRGRVEAINQWHPQIIIDGHEMGSEDTYLFSPAREPINRHLPEYLRQYGGVFAADQAAAFDAHAWPYYTGEWNDNFYPGYTSYAMFRGSLFILYEQARTAEDGVRMPEGTVRTYRQSVHHQLVSTLANLESLAAHSEEMYRRFAADRRAVLAPGSPYADVTYAVLPSQNASRWHLLAEKLLAQDFEVFVADADLRVTDVTRMDGETEARATIPAGSLVIPNRQPEARLLAAILEFDAEISEQALVAERQEVLRTGEGTMYDVTAWNLEMMYALEAMRVPDHLDSGLSPYERPPAPAALAGAGAGDAIAWVVDGADDRSLAFAARLMEQGVRVRMVDRATTLDALDVSRGSILVGTNDNPGTDLAGPIAAAAGAVGVTATGIGGGLGAGDLPDVGGRHFQLLQRPRVAVLSREGSSAYDFGAIWHSLDSNLGIRHSHLDQSVLGRLDLRRYNVLILPDRRRGGMPAEEVEVLDAWVKAGGTLIAIKGAVPPLVDPETGISSVRLLGDTFADAGRYDVSLQREWLALASELPDSDALRGHAVPLEVEDPVPDPSAVPGEEELKQRDEWQSIFMPGGGAVLAGRVDPRDWLTAGVPETLPVLYGNGLVLMSDDASRAVVRLGVLKSSSGGKAARLGWATIPEGRELWLRMSGLVWPEAQQRIANSAYVTRERVGNGQIILFADTPIFRGATLGTARLLLNAVVYGPGLGTRAVVEP